MVLTWQIIEESEWQQLPPSVQSMPKNAPAMKKVRAFLESENMECSSNVARNRCAHKEPRHVPKGVLEQMENRLDNLVQQYSAAKRTLRDLQEQFDYQERVEALLLQVVPSNSSFQEAISDVESSWTRLEEIPALDHGVAMPDGKLFIGDSKDAVTPLTAAQAEAMAEKDLRTSAHTAIAGSARSTRWTCARSSTGSEGRRPQTGEDPG